MGKDKRYLIFAFDEFYPAGGFNDKLDSFDNTDDAVDYAINSRECKSSDIVHVYDRIVGEIVLKIGE